MSKPPSEPLNAQSVYKLSSPAHLPEKLLQRIQLLDEVKHLQAHAKKVIAIEAQAGSGKTVFAQQYLQQSQYPAGWYQLGPEDHDPVALLHTLVLLLQQHLPGFLSKNVATALEQGSIHYREAANFGAYLAQEITESSGHGFRLVFDDFHLLDGAEDSITLLTTLIRNTPPWMQWILISRHAVKEVLKTTRIGLPTLIIGNDELDFSLGETAELLSNVFGMSLPLEQIQRLHRQTEGWVTGLVLCAMQSLRKRKTGKEHDIAIDFDQSRQRLADYFQEDALADFSATEVEEILRMVLLEDLPRALLNRLFGRRQTEILVKKMELSNRFFRCLDDEERVYSFHHLFRDSLLPVATAHLSAEIQKEVGLQAALYHLENGRPLQGLHYALQNEDMQMGENILQDFGLELLHRNQIKTLHRILERFPRQTIEEHPWLSFYYGTCLQDSEPAKAYPLLTNARSLFAKQNNKGGLLAANSQLIEYHTLIDGHFNRMAKYATELDHIFSEKSEELPPALIMRVAYSLAMGFCFLQTDMGKVKRYDTLALKMSTTHRLDNMTAMARVIRVYRFSFVGNWTGAKEELEESFSFLTNPRVASLTKLFIIMAQINLLEMMGDFENYRHQRQQLEQFSENDAIAQSLISPFIYIWNIDSALAQKSLETAEKLTENAFQRQYAALGPHMRSQFLHYQAILLALRKKQDESLYAIEESLALRKEAGGNSFLLLNRTLIGKAYALLGMAEEAENQFAAALQISDQLVEEFQRAAILAHRAWLRQQTGVTAKALQDAEACLKLMKKNGYKHFFSFMPDSMLPVLKLAFDNNVERDFVIWLLFEQLHMGVTKAGDFVPLLEIRLLSDWSVTGQDGRHLSLHDLNRKEIILLFSLVEEPDNRIDKNVISELLWPNKEESKQRTSLDVLLSGLRKRLAPLIAPHDPKEYLIVDQGKIKLQHCRIDVLQFIRYISQAENHLQKEQFWQAGNCFFPAFRLWGKMGLKGLQWEGLLPSIVENKYIQATKTWGSLLEKQGKLEEACLLLENSSREVPLNREIARQLYNLHANRQNPAAARKVVHCYRESLLEAGYAHDDIESEEFAFWGEK